MNVATGASTEAYLLRMKGYSPDEVRNGLWKIVQGEVAGVVLDAGSGEGGWIRVLKGSTEVERIVSVDLVDDGASRIPGVEFHIGDLSALPLPCADGEVDWVFALEVMEHLANPRYFVHEVHRSLKSGGRFAITTPSNDCLTSKLSFLFRGYFPAFCDHDYHASGHITPITELDMRRMAQEAGFSNIAFYYTLPGRIPRLAIHWQRVFPFLKGKAWSDKLIAVLAK